MEGIFSGGQKTDSHDNMPSYRNFNYGNRKIREITSVVGYSRNPGEEKKK